ncbi:PDR/VanB family oxidoreductase [Mycolicibacterium sp. CBMA 226]|uniref:PDR/VanB family oxidoreductase n=1 Tax=Mycolicibacterium sp. CBMA 226 TaxID=2606611 RepID=UPI0012DCB929|nr:PDR/VanB family oxidoreductase [Mycolicibacterium sp. CBMA 226]MUL79058.1 oxidoreductase [Mycolicibacterium sp. CBMA 226]QGW61383.1 Phenoxybenzoate dioxygenase subunit beta [Mycolicibacterium sp.]
MRDEIDLRLRVAKRTTGADGIVILDLRAPSGSDLPPWRPGAHIELELKTDLVRQYSLCGDNNDQSMWRIAVLNEPQSRGGSRYVHLTLTEGAEVNVRGPRNHFPLIPSPSYLFIVGGIGITPVLPMIGAIEAAGATWELHYGGRSRRTMAFLDPLENATGNRVLLYPSDEVGRIDLDAVLGAARPDTLVYCCGPERLVAAVEQRCAANWPAGALRVERFSPKAVSEPTRVESFEVELAVSNQRLTVPPEKSILQVIHEAGISVPYSCEEGICGTCEISVRAGTVDHRDSLLTPDEQAANDCMLICVSRAAGPKLVLDI